MPLPTGTWIANINGQRSTLAITSVDISGEISGTMGPSPNPPPTIFGLWDEITQKLNFGWSIGESGTGNANFAGVQQQLVITSVNDAGQVVGEIPSGGNLTNQIYGFWDEDGQKLTAFISSPVALGAGTVYISTSVATAYLFTDPINLTGVNGSVIFHANRTN